MDLKTYALSKLTGGSRSIVEAFKLTNAYYFCYSESRIDVVSEIDFSECTIFNSMFYNCSNLTTIPELNTSSGTNFGNMFYNCSKLTTIPELNTSSGTNFSNMFYNCSKLTTIPELNTSSGTNFSNMFYNCSKLTTIPELNTNRGTNFNSMFYGCASLTNLTIYNVRKPIQIGSGTSWGHLLTVDSLVHTIQELCKVSSLTTLTMGIANLEKIANLYCKVLNETDEKKPMELCESTDEGAMTLTEYAASKNWQFK